MKDESTQDAVPESDAVQEWFEARRSGRRETMRLIATTEAVIGLPMLLGPDIMSGLLGLPEGAPPYVVAVGAVLLLRSILMHAILRRER
jgi:hypothetical protein